jgi:hypothetical protein
VQNVNKTATKVWQTTATFAIDASGEREAKHILGTVLGRMGLTAGGALALNRSDERLWIASVEVDLSGLDVIEPDDAKTRATYVIRQATGATWHTISPREDLLIYDWPPSLWLTELEPRGFLDPAVRAVLVRVSYQ